MIKRMFDASVSVFLLLVLLPVFLAVTFLIWLRMGRPIFFVQCRPGLHAKPFNMIKFRTMNNDLSPDGQLLPDNLRISSLGHFLRSTSIDELPELLNVLRGDMSLVGPRPLLFEYLELYDHFQRRRHEALPGITGWAQVNGRNALTWEEKFELDVWYVDNRSMWLDMKILFKTVLQVLKRDGISHGGDATMPRFKGSNRDS